MIPHCSSTRLVQSCTERAPPGPSVFPVGKESPRYTYSSPSVVGRGGPLRPCPMGIAHRTELLGIADRHGEGGRAYSSAQILADSMTAHCVT